MTEASFKPKGYLRFDLSQGLVSTPDKRRHLIVPAEIINAAGTFASLEEAARSWGQEQGKALVSIAGEDVLEGLTSEVLTHDRVSEGIDAATCITTGMCYCRHKMEHLGEACDAPMDVCLTFNDVAKHLAGQGIAREISKAEAHAIVKECMDHGLMQIGDNTRSGLAIICNCCGCCCDLLLGYKRFGSSGFFNPSAFIADIDSGRCTVCGVCVDRCPADCISGADGEPPTIDLESCLGCGICARFCPTEACHMEVRAERPYVPADFIEKTFLAAIDAGKLGNYLFDDQTSRVHAVLRRAFNAVISVDVVKRVLLSKPVRSGMLRAIRAGDPC